jgi:hypothetical protein
VTDTVRERVLAAFFARLEGITGVYGLKVERNRDTEVTTFPFLVQVDGDHEVDEGFATGIDRYLMTVTVEGYGQAPQQGETVQGKLDQLYGKVVQALAADHTLSGLAVDVEEQSLDFDIDRVDGHQPGGAFSAAFRVEFWTKQGDPFTVGP